MRLADTYSINVRYQRATRIDNDLSTDFFPGLVFHGTAENTLRTLGKQFAEGHQRAFTITGPYGTGKSTIALLLTGFLHHRKSFRDAASASMKEAFFSELASYLPVQKGWLIVRAVSGVENPLITLWSAIHRALADHPETKDLAANYMLPDQAISEDRLEKLVIRLFKDAAGKVDGVYFMLDEMGKALEYFIKHDLDMQFFQNFAESFQGASVPCIFAGFLHQAFSDYARGKGKSIQDKWAKIQGRYSDLLYNVSEDETVALIAQSIEDKSGRAEVWHKDLVAGVCMNVQRTQLRNSQVLQSRLQGCFPLHPVVALMLGPISKRRFSQNERSTFSFLNSREPHSFHNFLAEHEATGYAVYRLHNLWDYLESNLEHHIAGTSDGHAWMVASEAIIRISSHGSETHKQLIKTIAMLNIFGRTLGLYATDDCIRKAMDHVYGARSNQRKQKQDLLDQDLNFLKDNSVVTFRKHLSAWAIFEGSDFDLEGLLELQRDALQFDDNWVNVLEYQQLSIAKRHYHEKGTLRWMDQRVVLTPEDVTSCKWQPKHGAFASFMLLAKENTKHKELEKLSTAKPRTVIGITHQIEPLKEAARELLALQLVVKDTPELQHDKIAAKEHEARTANARNEFDEAYRKAFEQAVWWFKGKQLNQASLNVISSRIADAMYPYTPEIFNELINREKPSGTSNAARRKLMEQMVAYAGEKNLGLSEGFPPEKAIYLSCLKQTGLHGKLESGDYGFTIPERTDFEGLKEMLHKTEEMINQSSALVTLGQVYAFWQAAPFGVTAGLCPILALAYLLSRDDELAYYDKDSTGQFIFIPEIDDEFVNKMMRAPKEVGVRHYEISGVKHHYIHSFARIASEQIDETSPQALSVARQIVGFVHKLPAWVKSSRNLGEKTKKFRDIVLKANDPYQLLLEDLYGIFGLEQASSEEDSDKMLEHYLNSAIDELRDMDMNMMNGYKKILESQLGRLDHSLAVRCNAVMEVAADFRLQAFAQRLSSCEQEDTQWLKWLIALVASAPEKDWNDSVMDRGKEELFEYCQRFKRVETFARASKDSSQKESASTSIALVVGSGGQAKEFVRQVSVNKEQTEEVNRLKALLFETLKMGDKSNDLVALALQQALQEMLTEYEAPVCGLGGA